MAHTTPPISLAGAMPAGLDRTDRGNPRYRAPGSGGRGPLDDAAARASLRGQPEQATMACDVAYLKRDGSMNEARHRVPALPMFEAAFSAFARGTLIATTHGPVAIEDLLPGTKVLTNERGPSPVLWIGSMSLRACPDSAASHNGARLTRIMTGALGLGRPMTDLMTGPGARIAQRNPAQTGTAHPDLVLRPVNALIDGTQVIGISPPGAVQLYHLALRRHATITAAGLAVETFHPGPGFQNHLTFRQMDQFMELFPHVMHPNDFGSLVYPRAPLGTGSRAVT